jgi:hypothetical protein
MPSTVKMPTNAMKQEDDKNNYSYSSKSICKGFFHEKFGHFCHFRTGLSRRNEIFCSNLKGHGNEADFPRFLHKSVRHWSLTLHFGPFRFWLRTRGDICNRKNDSGKSERCLFSDSASRGVANFPTRRVADSPTRQVGESAIECLKENSSLR